jgi:hypothetical protein
MRKPPQSKAQSGGSDHLGEARGAQVRTRGPFRSQSTDQTGAGMRLSPALVEKTLSQFEAQAIPENHPAMPELNRLFGDHTFFLDSSGLHIVEPTVGDDQGKQSANVVKLASWNDAERTSLAAHDPEPTDVMIELGSGTRDSMH